MKYTVYIEENGMIYYREVSKAELKKLDVSRLRMAFFFPENNRFFQALGQVESGGNSVAVGDGGKARGIYQIWKIYVDDVNRIYGTCFDWENDAFDVEMSKIIVTAYLTYWRHDPQGKCDKVENWGHLAVLHNMGGPEYWRRAHYVSKFIQFSKKEE